MGVPTVLTISLLVFRSDKEKHEHNNFA